MLTRLEVDGSKNLPGLAVDATASPGLDNPFRRGFTPTSLTPAARRSCPPALSALATLLHVVFEDRL